MLWTRLCDLLDITVPVVVAPFGPWDETALAVEACRAGALGSLGTARALRTELVNRLERAADTVDPERVGHELRTRVRAGGGHDPLPFAGQSVQLVHDVVPARELIARLVAEAEDALRTAERAITTEPTPRPRVSSAPPGREPVDEHA
jgi:NAD(P)H-dependent flavin oxidoreductase YrpB (nitropropane dioxygenase family)